MGDTHESISWLLKLVSTFDHTLSTTDQPGMDPTSAAFSAHFLSSTSAYCGCDFFFFAVKKSFRLNTSHLQYARKYNKNPNKTDICFK